MFYSQKLAKPQIANVCARCEMRFDQWSIYHAHTITNKCIKKILPTKTSDRTSAKIIADMEATWGNALFNGNKYAVDVLVTASNDNTKEK